MDIGFSGNLLYNCYVQVPTYAKINEEMTHMATKSVKKEAPAAVKAPETKAVEVKAAAEKAVENVKATAEKAVETVAKKAAPAKKAVKKAAAPVKAKVEKAAAPVKEKVEKAVKAVKAPKTTVYVEYQGRQADVDKLVAAVKAQVGAVKDLQLYVKPEDSAVYYVANGDTVHGKVNF